jgi:hypothetical protein
VYSAAIKGLSLDKGGRVKNGGPDSGVEQIVVIRDHTTIYGTPGSDTVSAWRTRGISIDDGTIEDFRRKSDEVVSLEPRFTPLVQQVLINDQEFASFFGKNGQSWRGFYQRYRNSIGCVALSPVGFNRDHNEALLYISRDCGNQCGNGYYVILGNQGTSWSVNHAVILFST